MLQEVQCLQYNEYAYSCPTCSVFASYFNSCLETLARVYVDPRPIDWPPKISFAEYPNYRVDLDADSQTLVP